ncbi:MAG: hypothetical protein IT581_06505 [Verrucomicrobiales bacterium]|nr:hypothetical protein [Verrucomicrobiales bacterium]
MNETIPKEEASYTVAKLLRELDVVRSERDQALKEIADLRRDAQWTMGHLKIADIFNTNPNLPAAEEGWLPLWKPDVEGADRKRLEFINTHGRVSLGSNVFVIALPILRAFSDDATIPTPYNIRHIIDLCQEP